MIFSLHHCNSKILKGVSGLMRQAQERQQAQDNKVLKGVIDINALRQQQEENLRRARNAGNTGYGMSYIDQNPIDVLGMSRKKGVPIPYKYKDGRIVYITYGETLQHPYSTDILFGNLKKATEYKRYINKLDGTVIYLTDKEATSEKYRNSILFGSLIKDPTEKARDDYWNDLKRMMNDPKTRKALEDASKKTEMRLEDLMVMALIESNGIQSKSNGSYYGLMQMGKDAVKDIQNQFPEITFEKIKTDVFANALAGAAYMKRNKVFLQEDGNTVSTLNLYFMHQQGRGGFRTLMRTIKTNPNALISPNQRSNKPDGFYEQKGAVLTQQEYYNGWIKKTAMIHELVQEYMESQ